MIIITLFCIFILDTASIASPISNDNYFIQYVKDIQSQIDNTVKPCDNFGKYACGNLKPEKMYSNSNILEQVMEILTNENPQNEVEKLIHTFYLSCKKGGDFKDVLEQIDVLKSVKVWPVNRDYNDEEIANLLAYFATINFSGLLSINKMELIQDNTITLSINEYFHSNKMASTLSKIGISSEESLKIIENVKGFFEELQKINTAENSEKNYDELKDVAALKDVVPNFDWDTYFKTFTNVFDFKMDDFVKKSVKIYNLEKLKNFFNVIKQTDSKIVANYLVWQYLEMSLDVKCENIIELFVPVLSYMNSVSKNENNFKQIFLNDLEVFNHYEKSMIEIKAQLNDPESETLKQYTKVLKNVYDNYEHFLSGQFLVELFSKFEINEMKLYSNLIHIIQAMNKDLLIHGINGNVAMYTEILTPIFEKFMRADNSAKTLMHHFIKLNTDLWVTTIFIDDIAENRTVSENCLPFQNKSHPDDRNNNLLNYHAAYHISLHDYINYVNEHKNELQRETEILTQAGLDHTKAYMLSLAQQACLTSNGKDLDDNHLLWFFKHSKDFSDSWSCSDQDEMNKVCDDSSFVPKFQKSS